MRRDQSLFKLKKADIIEKYYTDLESQVGFIAQKDETIIKQEAEIKDLKEKLAGDFVKDMYATEKAESINTYVSQIKLLRGMIMEQMNNEYD